MNSRTKLLCAFAVLLFIGSLAIGSVSASYALAGTVNSEQLIPAETYGDGRRNEAVNILIYTELADLEVDGEYDNVMSSLIGSLEGKFTYDNLTDYTQLGSVIDEFDVLLILENEYSNYTMSNTIAGVWQPILPSFVENGGIVICMGFEFYTAQRGATHQILNATGLMEIYNPADSYPHQMNLIDTDDALARNIPATYTSSSGTVGYDTTDGTIVVEDNVNSKAVVVHKTMGKGHVVLLGFDMYTVEANQDRLLQNAVLLHRHVIFDSGHGAADTIFSGFEMFANDLVANGFAVSNMPTFDAGNLTACDVLVLSRGGLSYTANDIDIIEDFVQNGGGLLILGEWGFFMDSLDPVIERLGYSRNKTSNIQDTDDNADGNSDWPVYDGNNLKPHAITVGVDSIETYAGSGFLETPENSFNFVVTDSDGTAHFSEGPTPILEELAIGVASLHDDGRVVMWGDSATFLGDVDVDSDASVNYLDGENDVMAKNIMRWLSAAGIPEQTVVFDQSHVPYGYIESNWNSVANLLMFNGYNVKWMDIFTPTVYEDADILVVCDGSMDYNTTEIAFISDFVAEGGALLLWGDHSSYCAQIDPIGQEFGLSINTTSGYLHETDDALISSSAIVYDGDNIGTHPIMDGVERIEVYRSNAFISIGSGTALISTDNDNTSTWSGGGPAYNLPVYAATTYNMGRVVFLTDVNLGTSTDSDSDTFPNLYDSDNPIFLANVFTWLAENRAPTVEVITPNGGEVINGTITIEWDAVDYDSDPLTYDIFYSDNNGSDWSVLANDLAVLELSWNTTLHDDGTGYMIRVIVSDGVLAGQDESDNIFELDNFVGGGPGLPLDLTFLLIIGAVGLVVVIVIVIIMKKKK
ncbi:MAG: hypothetical protein ACTSW7_06175 [Candidatus Thorarchaeota archaeon]